MQVTPPGLTADNVLSALKSDAFTTFLGVAIATTGLVAAAFAALRRWNLALFSRVGPSGLRRAGEHGWFGRLTIGKIARMLAGHDRNHLGRIREILARR